MDTPWAVRAGRVAAVGHGLSRSSAAATPQRRAAPPRSAAGLSPGATDLRGGELRLLDSPIRFMRARTPAGAWLVRPFVPVALNAALLAGVNALAASRTTVIGPDGKPVTAQTMPRRTRDPAAVIFGLLAFAVQAGAVVGIDALVAQSRLQCNVHQRNRVGARALTCQAPPHTTGTACRRTATKNGLPAHESTASTAATDG